MEPIIQLTNVSFHYESTDKRPAVDQVSLEIYPGEWVAVIGHNGSGKSTLAKLINGLLVASQGQIIIDGQELNEDNVYDIRRSIGMVFQNPDNQFVGTTVEDDIAFGLENLGMERSQMVERVNQALETVSMTDFKLKEPARLSGGQKQRVAIAGVTALAPKVIILDEATSMLDPQGRKEVLETIRQLHKEKGITVLSITHDLDEAASADRLLMMDQGKLVRVGLPQEIFADGKGLIQKGLDVPFSEKLKDALATKGLQVPQEYMTEEGMVDWLWTSVLNK